MGLRVSKNIWRIIWASEKYVGQEQIVWSSLRWSDRGKGLLKDWIALSQIHFHVSRSFFLDFGRVTFCHIRHWRDLWSWTLPKGSKISSYLTANSSSPHQTSTQTRKIRSFLTILSTRPSRACSRRWSGVNHNVQLVAGSLYIWDQLRRGRGHLALGPDQTLQGFKNQNQPLITVVSLFLIAFISPQEKTNENSLFLMFFLDRESQYDDLKQVLLKEEFIV